MPKKDDAGSKRSDKHNWLDSEHNALVEQVLNRDTPHARRELARLFRAELAGEIEVLREEKKHLGSRPQIEALEASGWTPWSRVFIVASWVIAAVDAAIWAVGAARVLAIK
jgi:hypothetical protein